MAESFVATLKTLSFCTVGALATREAVSIAIFFECLWRLSITGRGSALSFGL